MLGVPTASFLIMWMFTHGGVLVFFFFFRQKTAYEMRISDWSSDVCSSDLPDRKPLAFLCIAASHFAATQHPDVRRRSAGGFSLARHRVAGGFGRRGGVSGVADPQRRFSSPEGPAADKMIGGPSRSWADVTRSAGAGQAQPL